MGFSAAKGNGAWHARSVRGAALGQRAFRYLGSVARVEPRKVQVVRRAIRRLLSARRPLPPALDGVNEGSPRALANDPPEARERLDACVPHEHRARRLAEEDPLAAATPRPALLERMLALERWLEQWPPPPTLVSVVLPTFNRVSMLSEAIASVQAQRHPSWELIVVDDGSDDETLQLLERVGDGRVRSIRTERVGSPTARNRGLELARGELIAYLDDDNVMAAGWLASVAWAFGRHPHVEVVYGARVVENASMFGSDSGLPRLLLAEYDRAKLERANFTDANVIAHRAGLDEAHWDPELAGVADWDLMLRLTERKHPLTLPALAVLYRTSAPHKQSAEPAFAKNYAKLLERLARQRDTQR